MPLLTNYFSNQHAIVFFGILIFNQSACYYNFIHLFSFFFLYYGTSEQHNMGLIAHSSMELVQVLESSYDMYVNHQPIMYT